MSKKNELPDGWNWFPLAEVAKVYDGHVPPGAETLLSVGDVTLWFMAVEDARYKDGVRWDSQAGVPLLPVKTVLLEISPRTLRRRLVVVPSQIADENETGIANAIDPFYFAYWLSGATQTVLKHYMTGTVMPRLSIQAFSKCEVPVPSTIDEQRQIVARIREESENCQKEVAALKYAMKYLDRDASNIINALVEGRLTKQKWTKQPAKKAVEEVMRLFLEKWPDLLGEYGSSKRDVLSEVGVLFTTIQKTVEDSEKKHAQSHDQLRKSHDQLRKRLERQLVSIRQSFDGLHQTLEKAIPPIQPQPELRNEWPIEVNTDTKEVTVKGRVYVIADLADALVLDALNTAKGGPVSRSTMQKHHLLLNDDDHLERRIKKIKKAYPVFSDLIQVHPKKYGYYFDIAKLA